MTKALPLLAFIAASLQLFSQTGIAQGEIPYQIGDWYKIHKVIPNEDVFLEGPNPEQIWDLEHLIGDPDLTVLHKVLEPDNAHADEFCQVRVSHMDSTFDTLHYNNSGRGIFLTHITNWRDSFDIRNTEFLDPGMAFLLSFDINEEITDAFDSFDGQTRITGLKHWKVEEHGYFLTNERGYSDAYRVKVTANYTVNSPSGTQNIIKTFYQWYSPSYGMPVAECEVEEGKILWFQYIEDGELKVPDTIEESSTSIEIGPNPFNKEVNLFGVQKENVESVRLVDSQGRVTELQSQLTINTGHFEPGIYTLVIRLKSNRLIIKRLVKK